jgi:hypothetical protein
VGQAVAKTRDQGQGGMVATVFCRQTPEVAAACPNWARTDLCGVCSVTGVSTAIPGGLAWLALPPVLKWQLQNQANLVVTPAEYPALSVGHRQRHSASRNARPGARCKDRERRRHARAGCGAQRGGKGLSCCRNLPEGRMFFSAPQVARQGERWMKQAELKRVPQ